jgi:alpha-beta hydrolase superfamily lysophospholipase
MLRLPYRQLKKPFFGRFMVPWRSPLSGDDAAAWEPVRFPSDSGAELSGLFAAPTAAPRGVMVLGHPMGREAKAYFLKSGLAAFYRQLGFHVLAFDFNGFGQSGMGSFDFDRDVVAAGLEARRRVPTLPIGYHGVSLGGQWSTIALADPSHPFRFATIESAAPTLESFWIRSHVAYLALRGLYAVNPSGARRIRMVARITEARGVSKVLFVYSRGDTWVPLQNGQQLIDACTVPKETLILERAEHALVMRSDEREVYLDRLRVFCEERLREQA